MINTLQWSIYMAKIVTESVVLTFSKIAKDSDPDNFTDDDVKSLSEVQSALMQVAQELMGDNIVVEVMRA
jgi:hypothetical protein